MQCLVVFSENRGVWWLKFLKSGFRHCFVILETDRGCISVDPISNSFSVKMLEGYELKGLLRWYKNMGMEVMKVAIDDKNAGPFFWAPLTCVEIVKRLIGLNKMLVMTPWQLYKHIKRTKSEYL